VYIALVELPNSTAKEVAKRANIGTELVYRVIPKLQEKGLVKKIIATPVRFSAIPIKEAVRILIDLKKAEASEAEKIAEQILINPPESMIRISSEPEIIMIPRGKAILNFTKNKFSAIKENFDTYLSSSILHNIMSSHEEVLDKIWSSGKVKTRVITEKIEPNTQIYKKLNFFREKGNLDFKFITCKEDAVYLTIFDNKEVVIRSTLSGKFLETDLYWSNNPCFVILSKVYFGDLWKKSIVPQLST
jgi:sugar-specific transcriptional regulator TrmB